MSFVYILTNEAMPGYVKIGITERTITDRILELDTSGMPLPFQCYYAAEVADHKRVERALHIAFGDSRVRKSREFFTVDPFRVKAILEILAIREVTPRQDVVADPEDSLALVKAVEYKRRFHFSTAGIPIGSVLTFARDESITCTVSSDTTVTYDGEVTSLSNSALKALRKCGYNWISVAGTEYWLFNGDTVLSLRNSREAGE